MKELIISNMEAGQRFDKYLAKCLPNAGKSFLYKMLRKKNITLNGKKADGSEKINSGDKVNIFFSDETFDSFAGNAANSTRRTHPKVRLNILYEDDNILVVDKPSGVLSQKAKPTDISLIEYITEYMIDMKYISCGGGNTFKPGICNRLDRNTSGIVVAGKTIRSLQVMSEAFRERTLAKYYICIVKGKFDRQRRVSGFLYKNESSNKVTVYDSSDKNTHEGAVPIETEYFPICGNHNVTLLKVHLITGKTHQIRAHLEFLGHPIAGDLKYKDDSLNRQFKRKYGVDNQMLHAYELVIPPLTKLGLDDGLTVKTEIPPEFIAVLKGENLWEHGIPEALEAQH